MLAYGYDAADDGSRFAIRIYDPNHPGRDDVELRAEVDPDDGRPLRDRVRLTQSTGEPLLGFFAQPYPPPTGCAPGAEGRAAPGLGVSRGAAGRWGRSRR